MQNDPLHDEQEDEEECANDLIDSDDEEDVPHIPSERLSAHQRDRREHRQAMDLAKFGIGGGCREGCCSIK